jgi:hypothetical protein
MSKPILPRRKRWLDRLRNKNAQSRLQQEKSALQGAFSEFLAGPVRFELTMLFSTPVFKTGAFNRSATDPEGAHDITVASSAI